MYNQTKDEVNHRPSCTVTNQPSSGAGPGYRQPATHNILNRHV